MTQVTWLIQSEVHRTVKENQIWWEEEERSEITDSVLGMLSLRWFCDM